MEGCIFALSLDQPLSLEEAEKIKDEWKELWWKDGENPPRLAILPSGAKLDKHDSLPGRYAYLQQMGDRSRMITFQEYDELIDFLHQEKEDASSEE